MAGNSIYRSKASQSFCLSLSLYVSVLCLWYIYSMVCMVECGVCVWGMSVFVFVRTLQLYGLCMWRICNVVCLCVHVYVL